MDSESDDGFGRQKAEEALDIGNGFDSEEEGDLESDGEANNQPLSQPRANAQDKPASKPAAGSAQPPNLNFKGAEQVENQPYDLAVDVNDSEEIESDEEADEVNVPQSMQAVAATKNQQAPSGQTMKQQQEPLAKGGEKDDDDDDDEDDKPVDGAYNPMQYANLPVSGEVKELFEYIQRFKPQKIELETKIRPFVPDFVPAVGEVDAFLKMSKPDGANEDLGITVLDEPCLNSEDKTVLELKYVQSKNVVRSAPMDVDSIDQADKKPKELNRWITAVQDLHKTRPPPTVNYSKAMPDFDVLMEEWQPEMEQALQQTEFPSSEIDMHVSDYARLVLAMCDIPVHKSQNNKAVVESLHVLFTLFVEFRNNQHFKQFQNADQQEGAETQGF